MILPPSASGWSTGGKSVTGSTHKSAVKTSESAFSDPNSVSSIDSVSNAQVSPMSTSVTSGSTSFLNSPVCNHTSLSDQTVCYGNSAHPFWDSADMGESIASSVSSQGTQLVHQSLVTGVSINVAFPNTSGPSTSYVTSGNYLAVGMVAQSQDNSVGQDYASFAMVYLTSNSQPMIIGEVWTLPDGQCGTVHLCSEAIFDWAKGWTCDCYTSSSFAKIITLTMQWNYCNTPCSGTLDWKATVDGVQYTLFSYTPASSYAQRLFHVGFLTDHQCATYTTIDCYYHYFQFGAMFYAYPNSGWNAYLGSPKYFDQSNHMWRLVQQSTTTLGPNPPDVPAFDYAYWIGGDGFSITNALDGCSNSGTFSGSSASLISDQLVIHPGSLVKGQIWDSNCRTDIYPPTSSFTGGPSAGSWQNSAFTLSITDRDTGKITAAPGGVGECFYSVESLIGNGWVTTHSTSVRICSSTVTVTIGSSADCQSQGSNSCRVSVWSEDYGGNFGPATFMYPSDGDLLTEGSASQVFWSCSLVGVSCPISFSFSSMVGSTSIWSPWSYSSGAGEVEMNTPSSFTAGWDTTTWGSVGNPPEVFAYVRSSDAPYAPQFVFSTSANAQFLGDPLPEGVNSDSSFAVNDGNWHLFQYAFGPYGDTFYQTSSSASWSNINQATVAFQYTSIFTSGNNYVDGFVFLNPLLARVTNTFSIDTVPPTVPTPISPANGAVTSTTPTLSWSAATDATSGIASYTLQLSTDPSFSTAQTHSGIPGTSTFYSVTSALSSATWYWRVEAVDVAGNVGAWSSTSSFIVGDFTIAASPTSVTVNVNAAGTSTISITGQNGFAGVVSLATNTTASCTVSPNSVTGSGNTGLSCTFTTTGNRHVAVTGTSGSLSHSVTVTFVVQDFTITASPTSVTVNANAAGTSTISLAAVNGFTGVASLATNSTSCTVSPTSVTGSGSSTLSCTFTMASTVHVGVTGASGSLSHSVTVTYVVRDFGISASSPATVNEGSSTTSTITVTYMNGFAGTVALTDIVPSGLTCGSISPSSVTGSGSATVSCSGTLAGSYVLTITGTSGSLIHSTSATFAFAGFTVTATSPSGNVGSSITSTITVLAVNGFSGTVSLTDTLASGLTCGAISPSSITGSGTATLSCSSTSTTNYSVTIRGTSGSLSHSATTVFAFTNFTLSPSVSSLTIQAGTTGQVLITYTSVNGFSGTISLSQGVTPVTTDSPTVPSSGTVTLGAGQSLSYWLTISTVTTTPQQAYTATVTGSSGSLSHSTSISLTITAPPPPPSYVFPATFTQSGGVSGSQVIALLGLPVSVSITLSSSTTQTGHLSVEIRRDIVYYPDNTFAFLNQTATVGSGTVVNVGSFTPSDLTGGCIGCVRHYFIRVWWAGSLVYDPTDPNTRENAQTTSSDFSVCCSQSNSLLTGGEQSSTGINIQSRNGFTGTVTLSLSATTLGDTTVSLSPTSVTLSSGQLTSTTLTVVTGSQTGTWSLTVTAQSGNLIRSVTYTITVSKPTGGGGGSVAAGTLITLADGTQVPVQNLRVGMQLLSYNMTTHQYVTTTLTRLVTVATNNTLVITTSTGKPLIVDQNPAQKVYVMLPNGTWTLMPVTQLQIGYKLFDATTQSWVPITSIHYENGGNHVMYDLYPTAPGNYIANGYLDPYKT